MSENITADQLTAFGGAFSSSGEKLLGAVDNAIQVSIMLEQFGLPPEQQVLIFPLESANASFWQALDERAPGLLVPALLQRLSSFHSAFREEARPMLTEKPVGRKFSAEQVKLVYSFFYNAINPDSPTMQQSRDDLRQMFTHFGLGEPMTQDEIIRNRRALIAIAQAEGKERK